MKVSTSTFISKSSTGGLWWACKFSAIDRASQGGSLMLFPFCYNRQRGNESDFHNIASIISWGQRPPSTTAHLNTGSKVEVIITELQKPEFKGRRKYSNLDQHYHSEWSHFSHRAPLSIWQRFLWGQKRPDPPDTWWCELHAYSIIHIKCLSPKVRQPAIEKSGTSHHDGQGENLDKWCSVLYTNGYSQHLVDKISSL